MSPEEQHWDAVEAVRAWRDDQRAQLPELGQLPEERYRLVWIDTGSGPGYEVLVPEVAE
jgi:hypothetical protein